MFDSVRWAVFIGACVVAVAATVYGVRRYRAVRLQRKVAALSAEPTELLLRQLTQEVIHHLEWVRSSRSGPDYFRLHAAERAQSCLATSQWLRNRLVGRGVSHEDINAAIHEGMRGG